jgi:hypothetical protein
MSDRDDAVAWHESRGCSRSLITLHLLGFLAGREKLTKNPLEKHPGIYHDEWKAARDAGAAPQPEQQTSYFDG